MFVREKKTVSDKPWQYMLHGKTIRTYQNLRYQKV